MSFINAVLTETPALKIKTNINCHFAKHHYKSLWDYPIWSSGIYLPQSPRLLGFLFFHVVNFLSSLSFCWSLLLWVTVLMNIGIICLGFKDLNLKMSDSVEVISLPEGEILSSRCSIIYYKLSCICWSMLLFVWLCRV